MLSCDYLERLRSILTSVVLNFNSSRLRTQQRKSGCASGLQSALRVWLLNLGIIGSALGQTVMPNTNHVAGDIRPTEVVFMGALHDFHRKNPHYTLEILRDLIVSAKPEAILVELPETSRGKLTVRDGRLAEEYAKKNEFWASQRAADELKVAIYPFDMDLLDDIRQETRFWERKRQAEKEYAAFLKAHQKDDLLAELGAHEKFEEEWQRSILTFAEKGTPEMINSEAFDSISRARTQLKTVIDMAVERVIRAHPQDARRLRGLDFVGEEWHRRNESMAQKIEGYAKRHQCKRIVVVVGAEHRYILRDLLSKRSAVVCKEYWELK